MLEGVSVLMESGFGWSCAAFGKENVDHKVVPSDLTLL